MSKKRDYKNKPYTEKEFWQSQKERAAEVVSIEERIMFYRDERLSVKNRSLLPGIIFSDFATKRNQAVARRVRPAHASYLDLSFHSGTEGK